MDYNLSLGLHLVYTGFYHVGTWWKYDSLVSPLYRLFYITNGECRITLDQETFRLTEGDIFLVPKFVSASYICDDSMEHYYLCLIDAQQGGTGVVNPSSLLHQTKITYLDKLLFERLHEICPGWQLPSTDPQKYDNRRELLEHKHPTLLPAGQLEIQGIVEQLFSRFLTPDSMTLAGKYGHTYLQLAPLVRYISENLSAKITVSSLAERAFLSPDHFSKLFKNVMGMSPVDYLQMVRLQRAQSLLLGTAFNMQEIAEKVGFETGSQLSRLFAQKLSCTPKEYRSSHGKLR